MASQERHILVQVNNLAPAFASTLFTPETGWQEGPGGKTSKFITTARIGRFKPATLGRSPTKQSRVRVYCDGPVVVGDTVTVLGSSISTEASPVSPVRTPAIPIGTSLETAAVLELGVNDDLGIDFVGNGTTATIHMVIYDLSEEEIERRDNVWYGLAAGGQLPTYQSRTVVVDGATSITQWTGTLYVAASATATGQTLPLTSLANVAIGARVVVYRDDTPAGVNAKPFSITANGAERINGGANQLVRMTVNQMAVEFERQANGWACIGIADSPVVDALSGSNVLLPWSTRIKTISWNPNAVPSILTLPALAAMAVGQAMVVFITALPAVAGRAFLIPAAGETINGVVDNASDIGFVNIGDAALITRVAGGWLGVEITQTMDRILSGAVLDPLWAAGWKGLRVIQFTNGAAINCTLPPPAACRIGMQLLAVMTNGAVTIQGNGANVTLSGTAAASRPLVQNVPVLLTYCGAAGWLGIS